MQVADRVSLSSGIRGNLHAATASARGPWPHSLACEALARPKKTRWYDGLVSFRERTSPKARAALLEHSIDVGFVNRRAVETLVGPAGIRLVDEDIGQLPIMAEALREIRIDRMYMRLALAFCDINRVPTLQQALTDGARVFCSTEHVERIRDIYDSERVSTYLRVPGRKRHQVRLEFTVSNVSSSTLRSELHRGAEHVSIIARFHRNDNGVLVFHPLVMGFPWLDDDPQWPDHITMWWRGNFYEHYVEDFDEFSHVADTPTPDDVEPMRNVSERAFKVCITRILGDSVVNDWGGETSDHFSAHLHLQGRRATAAFLFKGPARFTPMKLNHLGKNNDQIYRLASEPADILIVQHSHEITPAVRATLRAFAVQPSNPRRYCLIDGRDSLRLLHAYDLYDTAVNMTRELAG
jgi:hypothetical protein